MFFLRKFLRTRTIKFSHSTWCIFNSLVFAPSLEKLNKKFEKNFPSTFLGKCRIEWWQSWWKQLCQMSENIYKNTFLWNNIFSSQSTSGHIGCFFDGPAEQNRTKFWRLFAQCPKSESRNFCETKVFSQKFSWHE